MKFKISILLVLFIQNTCATKILNKSKNPVILLYIAFDNTPYRQFRKITIKPGQRLESKVIKSCTIVRTDELQTFTLHDKITQQTKLVIFDDHITRS